MEVNEKDYESALCAEIEQKFFGLQSGRKSLERKWQLNMKFVEGEQYFGVTDDGELEESKRRFFWETRRVFNHIAPVVDFRLSKLARIRPALAVRPASGEEEDVSSAAIASAILSSLQSDGEFESAISAATMWSEICGTAFYKIIWNSAAGKTVGITESGKGVREGGVSIIALSPFEIYPFSPEEESVEKQQGIIHAKIVPVEGIFSSYGVKLEGKPASAFGNKQGYDGADRFELVIEQYLKPNDELPDGRLTVVAGGRVLYDGALPYINADGGTRGYPFVKQTSEPKPGSFFGTSVVERLIPVQRAYNAVKNRKHEYLNRISLGCIAVEDGSVDLNELEEDGLAPGKVITFRQGSTPPQSLSLGGVPEEFFKEEESLLREFDKISGSGDISDAADNFSGITSATGLQLIIDQSDAKLNVAYQSLARALKDMGRQALRLYRQFATQTRLIKYASGGSVEREIKTLYFKGSDITGDDVILDADADLNLSPAQRREVIYELMDRGLLSSGNDLSANEKKKILEYLGYSSFAPAAEKE